jgi:ubiquinone/menaquinone biosynthesis C-methylase UbiE
MATAIEERDIQKHWQANPVGENVFGRLSSDFDGDYEKFFKAFDGWLYSTQGHILTALNRFDWTSKRVLEIGIGQGADSEQLVRRGARWSGVDLTEESIARVAMRFKMRGLSYERIERASALELPFEDGKFDAVYSHGVLHHIPKIREAQREIRRVLKPDGRLVAMLYAKNSLNYQLSIKWLRRIGLVLLYYLPIPVGGIYRRHKENARTEGLFNYLKMDRFVSRATDGPDNPYTKVYDLKEVAKDFPDFEVLRSFQFWMHAPPLPVHGLPGGGRLGWHLWVEMKPRR